MDIFNCKRRNRHVNFECFFLRGTCIDYNLKVKHIIQVQENQDVLGKHFLCVINYLPHHLLHESVFILELINKHWSLYQRIENISIFQENITSNNESQEPLLCFFYEIIVFLCHNYSRLSVLGFNHVHYFHQNIQICIYMHYVVGFLIIKYMRIQKARMLNMQSCLV